MKKRILIVSTENACRSQMAEGILKSLDKHLQVFSAGTNPSNKLNPLIIIAMDELGIDVRNYYPKNVTDFLDQQFDYILTVCDKAKLDCRELILKTFKHQHFQIGDPSNHVVNDEEIMNEYRKGRDKIYSNILDFYLNLRKN